MPRLCMLYPGIRLTTEEKITGGGTLSLGSRKVPAGHDSLCQGGHFYTGSLDKSVGFSFRWVASGDLVQPSVSVK